MLKLLNQESQAADCLYKDLLLLNKLPYANNKKRAYILTFRPKVQLLGESTFFQDLYLWQRLFFIIPKDSGLLNFFIITEWLESMYFATAENSATRAKQRCR